MENFLEDRKSFKIAVVIDGSDAIFIQMEMINHVFVVQISSGGFVGDVDGVLEW